MAICNPSEHAMRALYIMLNWNGQVTIERVTQGFECDGQHGETVPAAIINTYEEMASNAHAEGYETFPALDVSGQAVTNG